MSEKLRIHEESVDLHIKGNEQKDVLLHLTDLLVQEDYVDAAYADEIIKREASFPTGLQFENIAIALPHGDSTYVKHSGLAIGRCDQEINFRSMDDPSKEITVDMIVLLAIKNPETHLTILKNMMEMFASKEMCQKVLSSDEKTLCEIFEKTLNNE